LPGAKTSLVKVTRQKFKIPRFLPFKNKSLILIFEQPASKRSLAKPRLEIQGDFRPCLNTEAVR